MLVHFFVMGGRKCPCLRPNMRKCISVYPRKLKCDYCNLEMIVCDISHFAVRLYPPLFSEA